MPFFLKAKARTAVLSMARAGAEPIADSGKSTGCGLSATVQISCSSKSPEKNKTKQTEVCIHTGEYKVVLASA